MDITLRKKEIIKTILFYVILTPFIIGFSLQWWLLSRYVRKILKMPFIVIANGLMLLQIIIISKCLNLPFYYTILWASFYLVIGIGIVLIFYQKSEWLEGYNWVSPIIVGTGSLLFLTVILSDLKPTNFFMMHDIKHHFNSMQMLKGSDITSNNLSTYSTSQIARKELQFSIKGDQYIMEEIVLDYKKFVQSELKKLDLNTKEYEVINGLQGFIFKYHSDKLEGTFKMSSYIDLNGIIKIIIFNYEFKTPSYF